MKTLKTGTFLILLFSMQSLWAQFGQGGFGGNQMGNQMGNQTGSQSQMNNQNRPTPPKERPVEELVKIVVDRLKKDLTLDELQAIAVTNYITDNMKRQNVILKKEGNNDEKTSELKAISEKTDLDILIILNKDQKAKYKLLIEDNKKRQEAAARNSR